MQTDASSTRDRLEYVADLLLELQSIATQTGCETLAGLLNLSHAEALRQSMRAVVTQSGATTSANTKSVF
ncbi:MAG: hypothetical protein ABL907_16270 [Hyphomicrobium sp.]